MAQENRQGNKMKQNKKGILRPTASTRGRSLCVRTEEKLQNFCFIKPVLFVFCVKCQESCWWGIRLVIPKNHRIAESYGTTMTPCTVFCLVSHFNKLHRREITNMKNVKTILEFNVEADEILWAPTVYTFPEVPSLTLMLEEPDIKQLNKKDTV